MTRCQSGTGGAACMGAGAGSRRDHGNGDTGQGPGSRSEKAGVSAINKKVKYNQA